MDHKGFENFYLIILMSKDYKHPQYLQTTKKMLNELTMR